PHVMHRLLLSPVSWLMLEAVLLNTVIVLSPINSCFPPPFYTSPSLPPTHPDCTYWLFKASSSISYELGLQCEQQSKHVNTLVHSFTLFHQMQERGGHLWSALVPVFFLILFFPRKLSPPSVEDGPFSS